jgi:phage gpG-like protein
MRISVNADGLQDAIQEMQALQKRTINLRPAWEKAGQYMVRQTIRERFDKQRSPQGHFWKKRSKATQAHYLRKYGPRFTANKILQFTGELRRITYTATNNGMSFGTNKPYGRTHQYGAKKGQFGTVTKTYVSKKTGKQYTRTWSIPWGDIPARPFLGITQKEREVIDNMIIDHILSEGLKKQGRGSE